MMGKSHEEYMIEHFRADPAYAVTLINSILEDGDDQGELQIFLRQMTAAFGIEIEVTENMSEIGRALTTIRALGLRLSVEPIPVPTKQPRRRTKSTKIAALKPKRAARVRRTAAKASAVPV